jgi:CIC family chloride channel protein
MRTKVAAFSGSSSVTEVAAHLRPDHSPLGQHLYPVLDEEENFLGVVTRKDLRKLVAKNEDGSIAAFARAKPVVAYAGEPLRVVVNRMASSGFTRMPVLDGKGKLAGMVSLQDLLNARARNLSEERDRERVIRIRLPFADVAVPENKR